MTREEAIKVIKEFINGTCLHSVDQEALETLIPELKESEDERIRKWILEKVQGYASSGIPCSDEIKMADKAIDYLEKQKEKVVDKEGMYYYLGGKFIYCGYPATEDNPYDFAMSQQEGKQKEQKPVEKPINWTELTWKDIVELEGIINNVHYEFRNGIGQESFGKEVLEKFREYKGDEYLDEIEQKPADYEAELKKCKDNPLYFYDKHVSIKQKPAEWNPTNEDVILFNKAVTTNQNLTPSERAKLDIIRMKFKHCNGHIATNDFDIALGERYIQGYNDGINESKPAEWSEEDEKDMAHITRILDDCYAYGKHDLSKTDHENLVNKLKSLRSSWKPSEAQLMALHSVIDDESDTIGNEQLKLLYSDLNKL